MTPNPYPVRPTRRSLLAGIAGLPLFGAVATARAAEPLQPASKTSSGYMEIAQRMLRDAVAAGDQPFGAVVVRGDAIVGWGPSRVVTDTDPTAHAEMIALRDAARRLGTRDLSGCVLYGTSHPCPMCEAGAHWANVDRFVWGDGLVDGGAPQLRRC